MFSNIGGKIKSLAMVLCFLGIVGSIIMAVISFSSLKDCKVIEESAYRTSGFIWLIAGPLASWVSSFTLYGLGQLIENSDSQTIYLKRLSEKGLLVSNMSGDSKAKSETENGVTTNNSNDILVHSWRCSNCGKMISHNPCRICGYKTDKISNSQEKPN